MTPVLIRSLPLGSAGGQLSIEPDITAVGLLVVSTVMPYCCQVLLKRRRESTIQLEAEAFGCSGRGGRDDVLRHSDRDGQVLIGLQSL